MKKQASKNPTAASKNASPRKRRDSPRDLGDEADPVSEAADLELDALSTSLRKARLPEEVAEFAEKEIEKLRIAGQDSKDYSTTLTQLMYIRDLPWASRPPRAPSFSKARRILNKSHFGLEKAKERIVEHLAVMRLKGQSGGPIILLSGPPGVGKTSLARAVAEALGRPFVRVALGGVSSAVEIRGHRKAIIGSTAGRIIQAVKRAKSNYPVVLLDEIDKIDEADGAGVSAALLEVLDFEQNRSFHDNYLEVPYDLSNILWIATANDTDAIPKPLLDRMETIWLPAYTDEEKMVIAQTHVIPDIREELGLKASQLKMDEEVTRFVMRSYTREGGVRQLRRELSSIGRKVALSLVESKKAATRPTAADVIKWLGPPRYIGEPNDSHLPPGVAIGLTVSDNGGDILYVETSRSRSRDGRMRLVMTGRIGESMRESALTVLSFLLARAGEFGIDPDEIDRSNIHVHFPDGDTPKDGPSAGVAILCALTSLFKNKPVSAQIAMTGEITLRGSVLAIGGIRDKLLAASRYGKNKILIPKSNWHDLEDISKSARAKMNVIPVETMEEVLRHAGLIASVDGADEKEGSTP